MSWPIRRERPRSAWPDTVTAGQPASNGTAARNADGGSVTATSLVWSPVTSVTMGSDGTPLLTLPGIGQVSTNTVRKVG